MESASATLRSWAMGLGQYRMAEESFSDEMRVFTNHYEADTGCHQFRFRDGLNHREPSLHAAAGPNAE